MRPAAGIRLTPGEVGGSSAIIQHVVESSGCASAADQLKLAVVMLSTLLDEFARRLPPLVCLAGPRGWARQMRTLIERPDSWALSTWLTMPVIATRSW